MKNQQLEQIESLHFNKIREKAELEYERVIPLIIPDNHLQILDIGCGEGLVTSLIQKRTNKVIGMDIINKYGELLKQRGLEFIKHDAEDYPYPFPDQKFDVITVLSVLEHLYRPDKCLNEVFRMLKKDGKVIICVPNYASLLYTLTNLMGKSFHSVTDEYHFYSHIKYFTYSSLLELLTSKGFFVDTVITPQLNNTIRYKRLPLWQKLLVKGVISILYIISPRWCQAPIIVAQKRKTKTIRKMIL